MSAPNTWTVGTFYVLPNGPNGLFTQPGGIGTEVFPRNATGVDYFSTHPFNEMTGPWSSGCGHSLDYPTLQQEVDYSGDEAALVILVLCAECSFINYSLPVADALSTVFNPQVVV